MHYYSLYFWTLEYVANRGQLPLQLNSNWLRKFSVIIVALFHNACLFSNLYKRAESQALLGTLFEDLLPSTHIAVGNSSTYEAARITPSK